MSQSYSLPCRRSYVRFTVEASASLTGDKHSGTPVIVGNLSPRGACVFSNESLEPNKQIEIELVYFFDKPVNRKAKVIWAREVGNNFWQIGLDFGTDNLLELPNSFSSANKIFYMYSSG